MAQLQSRTFQQKILTSAARDNFHGLHWYIEARVSHRLIVPVCWPAHWVPLIPVAPDPQITRHYAEILRALIISNSDPHGYEFNIALTHDEALQNLATQCYTYGELDHICPWCAVVGYGQCHCPSTPPPHQS